MDREEDRAMTNRSERGVKEPGQQRFEDHIARCLAKGWNPGADFDLSWKALDPNAKSLYAKREAAGETRWRAKMKKLRKCTEPRYRMPVDKFPPFAVDIKAILDQK
jgi:hypothetical protein